MSEQNGLPESHGGKGLAADRMARLNYGEQQIIYVPGVFDLLHQGHLNILQRSKDLGDILVVGVVSDDGAEAYKRRPVQDEQTRLSVIRSLRMVDFAVLQPTTDPTPCLEIIRPHVLTHGSDWSKLREGQETLERLGIEFKLLPYTPGICTGDLIARTREVVTR